jgi:hypothetical protein
LWLAWCNGWAERSIGVMAIDDFEVFIAEVCPRLARAFVSAYGPERGEEALSEAMVVAWEQFDEIAVMANPAGFLYRVGQTRSKPRLKVPPTRFPIPESFWDCPRSSLGCLMPWIN